jgi:hypothetical protein
MSGEQMLTDNTPQPPGLFGVYLQAGDLDRSLSFYRDVPSHRPGARWLSQSSNWVGQS